MAEYVPAVVNLVGLGLNVVEMFRSRKKSSKAEQVNLEQFLDNILGRYTEVAEIAQPLLTQITLGKQLSADQWIHYSAELERIKNTDRYMSKCRLFSQRWDRSLKEGRVKLDKEVRENMGELIDSYNRFDKSVIEMKDGMSILLRDATFRQEATEESAGRASVISPV